MMTRFWKAAAGLKNMWANLDQYTPPNSTVLDRMNRAKNTVTPPPVKDQINAKVEVASSERMNRSARSSRKLGRPSAATSARIKNQNQYPPTASISAPMCHSCGSRVDVEAAGAK